MLAAELEEKLTPADSCAGVSSPAA